MKARRYLFALFFSVLSAGLCGCAGFPTLSFGSLPPQACKPSPDLPASKQVALVPEVATSNERFYEMFLEERVTHAKDDRDYNSLYAQCVGTPPG